jgi:ferredoxin-NADP reductase/Na+-translocating ferredoxin:NAD+ oxidoreductase RnfD subunit
MEIKRLPSQPVLENGYFMIKYIDDRLNQITMYRLVLYYLIFVLVTAVIFSAMGLLAYNVFGLLVSISFFLAVCWIINRIFSRIYGVPANVESVYISALILALIISPIQSLNDLWFMGWAAVLAMASKYIIAIKGKHLFNPVAFAVALTYFTINQSASWWVGNGTLLPVVLLGGLLIVRKIGRFDMVISFLVTTVTITGLASLFNAGDTIGIIQKAFQYSPLLFFAFIILTEPLTTPPSRNLRIYYGALVGLLFVPEFHIGSFYVTPEIAILIGNIYSYIVSPKANLILRLKERIRIAPDVFDFVFSAPRNFKYLPGQYMEWTLGHRDPDDRGNRRYFTLASSPTEQNLRLGIKFSKKSSSFKRAMLAMSRDTEIVASRITGDFILPGDARQKSVFLAGGIGVTPFRSMIKYLLDTHQKRPITLLYAAKTPDDIVYTDIFDRAEKELGIKVIYTLTDNNNVPASWTGKVGRISPKMIQTLLPDYRNCVFYISGSRGMVDLFKDTLRKLKLPAAQIKTDYFAGLA